ncbi:MAG: LmbE family protein [Cytophagaceae bacterium]|nr:LmbE family protein [Cytophagaceae bacterium]|tara:strand:- start:4362 stop:6872 length:2511 start_codon:yes stop_codon:yes gene_type:complete
MRRYLFLVFLSIHSFLAQGQKPEKLNSSQIFEKIEDLNFLGTALYIAAHPDDENTTMISYLANEVHARTGYLSLTRGDGGQNLIGPEIRELLGVIRTEELLAARRIDGGVQRFTRANDFGFSKHPDETLEIWDKDEVLGDVVWAIRKFKPDVIINRFDHRTPGTTHGHHTSSAILSHEAFDLVGDASQYPEQLKYTQTWQPKRQFLNTSSWFYRNREAFEQAMKDSDLISMEIGVYYPSYGLSNNEISSLSRSQHKSQGMGNTGSRGSQMEYLELINGDKPKDGNLFDGIDTSWNRVKGGSAIGDILYAVQENYDHGNPAASLPGLIKAYSLITKLEDTHWRPIKENQIKQVIKACAGLYLEAVTDRQTATKNENVTLEVEAINRSDFPVKLDDIIVLPYGERIEAATTLNDNTDFSTRASFNTGNAALTTPYWLREEGTLGMYRVDDQQLIGEPETPRVIKAVFDLDFDGVKIPITETIAYKYNDRVDGEVFEPFEIVPPVSVAIDEPVIIFADAKPKNITVKVTAYTNNLNASVTLRASPGWKVTPTSIETIIPQKGESRTLAFEVTPPANQDQATIEPVATIDGKEYNLKVQHIDYKHIPLQTLSLSAKAKVVRLNIEKKGNYIGYIEGAGDVVPQGLEQMGYQVAKISPENITPVLLKQFDAVVVGIRAYNVSQELRFKQPQLLDYVKNGGTMIVQYNTARGFDFDGVGPYPLALSNDRVTREDAAVKILDPKNELLNVPNKITEDDFKGWVQERGLYFPNTWDSHYTPIFSMHDDNEAASDGSLLITKYGEGHYIYTGLSFFRELPAGVPGAFRLFANMLSVGKNDEKIKG